MTDEIREALLALISDISSGRVRPLSGPLDLYDGNGTRIHVPAGQALSDMDLLTMQTFIAGVHGEAPKMQEGATLELVSVGGP